MDDNTIWPPPPSNQMLLEPVAKKSYYLIRFLQLDIGFGIVLGAFNATRTDELADWLAFFVAGVLGYIHPRTGWISVVILTLFLYLAHVIAITHGIKYPYVEHDINEAFECWGTIVPYGFWAFVGAIVKIIAMYIQRNLIKS